MSVFYKREILKLKCDGTQKSVNHSGAPLLQFLDFHQTCFLNANVPQMGFLEKKNV